MIKYTKFTLWALLGLFFAGAAVRTCQIAFLTDMTKGFIYHEAGFWGECCFYAVVIAALVVGVILCAADLKKRGAGDFPVAAVVDARAAVIGFGLLIVGLCAMYEGYTEISAITPSGFVIFIDFVLGGGIVIAAFFTLYLKEFKPALGFSYVVGAAYFMLRGIAFFLDHMAISSVPEYLIDALTIIAAAVFFMLFAKLFSGNGQKNTGKALCGVGSALVVLSLSSAVSTWALYLFGGDIAERIAATSYEAELFYNSRQGFNAYMLTFTPWVNVAVGVFSAAVMVVLFLREKQTAAEQTDENE